jgi:hypothetical protein
MSYKVCGYRNGNSARLGPAGFALLAATLLSGLSGLCQAANEELSDQHSMEVRVVSADVTISQSEVGNIRKFFHAAERAIEAEDLPSLMALYSDRYANLRNGDKKFAEDIWKRIFAGFDNLSSRHSMELVMYDGSLGQAVTLCSGLLTGTAAGENRSVVIDSWDNQRHILVKEGNWKLFGNAGATAQRFGLEGEPIHPLF